ncbi:PCNA-interacting partner [Lampris incognitus]|uniref:PCNA-interacting partner n=1 Tax=Lampris incognitus TaxID=2546036 RepID=UPI0024B5569A|nr:PCNA-interacting partner [Lampris incognitus]
MELTPVYQDVQYAYETFLKCSNTVDLVDVHSMYKQLRADSDPEELVSPVKTAVRRVFCSYLDLLVNSKNNMALARTLDIPSRSLGRAAFTDLKRAARNNSTSLFLAATSFVRAIQLGGKGYAPAPSDPLRKHIQGLSDFVQFLDNLEEILGEIPDPSMCGARLVAAIRAVLVKGRSSGDEIYAAAEETAKDLKKRILELNQSQKQTATGTGISPARPRAYAINHGTAYGGRETVKVLMAMLDEEALAPPCHNKADLLSEDQAVLSETDNCVLALFRSPEAPTGCSPEPLRNRVQSRQDLLKPKVKTNVIRSQFACTYRDEELPLGRVLDFPSTSQQPTCVQPAPKRSTAPAAEEECSRCTSPIEDPGTERGVTSHSEERRARPGPRCRDQNSGLQGGRKEISVHTQGKAGKRKQVDADQHSASENQPPQKKSATSVSGKMPKNVQKAPSKKKQISGQGKLTSFFRV